MREQDDANLLTLPSSPITNINFCRLSSLFYAKIRNEITPQRLELLYQEALCIKEPKVFGFFQDDESFLKTLKLLHLSTQETRHRKFFLLKILLKRLPSTERMLDVGCGFGQITKLMAHYFKEIVALDTNKLMLEFVSNIKSKNCKITILLEDMRSLTILQSHYDLIVFSHSLYYVNQSSWIEILKKAYESLKEGGFIVVILTDNQDKRSIGKYFGGTTLNMGLFVKKCVEYFGFAHIEYIISNECFVSQHLINMLHICNMHLHDVSASAAKKSLIDYIEKNLFSIKDNQYILRAEQIYLLIKKVS